MFLENIKLIFGISKTKLKNIYNTLGLNKRNNNYFIKKKHELKINSITKKLILDHRLKDNIKETINFGIKIKTYKGLRNKFKYPSRGQRTHTNAKTKKKFQI